MQSYWLLSLLVNRPAAVSGTVETITCNRHPTGGRLHSQLVHAARQRREFNEPLIAKRLPVQPAEQLVARQLGTQCRMRYSLTGRWTAPVYNASTGLIGHLFDQITPHHALLVATLKSIGRLFISSCARQDREVCLGNLPSLKLTRKLSRCARRCSHE